MVQGGCQQQAHADAAARECLRQCWSALALRHGCAPKAGTEALDELIGAYREAHRHYHTLDHIAALLVLLDRHGDAAGDRDALALAILFHDAVYDPMRRDNEEASAALAARRLTDLGFPDGLCAKVVRCILATRHEPDADATSDPDVALLLDLDLSVLAAPPAAYRGYAQAVRREYAHVPDALYRPARKHVLEGFLARDQIYRTDRLHALWETPARANLAAEIAELA
jgi:predicted metal-dependent HD superfamily phosphohydrolase